MAARLRPLLETITAALDALAPREPLLVRVLAAEPAAGRPPATVAVRPLSELEPATASPLDALVGYVAPESWLAIGIAAPGRITGSDARSATVVYLVTREGDVASRLAGDVVAEEPAGRAPDYLARALGRPTPPPPFGPGAWVDRCWLDRMVSAAAAEPAHRWPWTRLARLHPLVGSDGAGGQQNVELSGPERPPAPEVLAELARQVDVAGWRALRQAAVGPPAPVDGDLVAGQAGTSLVERAAAGIDPHDATWFDEGSLCRWLTDRLPPTADLLDAVDDLLASTTAAAVRRALSCGGP